MYQTRSVTRKQREKEETSPTADGNEYQAGSAPAVDEPCIPSGQRASSDSVIRIGNPDIASFATLEDFLAQEPQPQEKRQEERQPVLYKTSDTDNLELPYLPWDCPGADHKLYPLPAMADDKRYPSPSYYVDPNFLENNYTHLSQHQYDEYQSLRQWIFPTFEEAAVLDVQGMQGQSQLGDLLFENSDGSYGPLPVEYAAMPDPLNIDPLLNEQWATTYEGELFVNPQAIASEAMPLGENIDMSSQPASSSQPPAAIAPIVAQQPHLPGVEMPVSPPPRVPPVMMGTKAAVEKERRRRQADRLREGPTPAVEIDWLPQGANRKTKDRYLVESRNKGVSYKLIKMFGRFSEAESTLRGRFRTLTKRREDRVRDPKWKPIDIHLLKEAVRVYAGDRHPQAAGISWMMVSKYITSHGGTYAFGFTTCHRRWKHLAKTGQLDQTWAGQTREAPEVNGQDSDEMEGVETDVKDEDDDEGEGGDDDDNHEDV